MFLKPAWQSPATEKRRLAVLKLDDSKPNQAEVLLQLASQDPVASIRQACIQRLNRVELLSTLLQTLTDETDLDCVQQTLSKRIAEQPEQSLTEVTAIVQQNPSLRNWFAEFHPSAEVRHSLLEPLSQTELAGLLAKQAYSETRKLIANQLQDPQALECARRALKGKDKVAERIVRSKLDAARKQKAEQQALEESAKQLIEQMRFIAEHPQWRAEFADRYDALSKRWRQLGLVDQKLQQAFQLQEQSAAQKCHAQRHRESTLAKVQHCCQRLSDLDQSLRDAKLAEMTSLWQQTAEEYETVVNDWKQVDKNLLEPQHLNEYENLLNTLAERHVTIQHLQQLEPASASTQELEAVLAQSGMQNMRCAQELSVLLSQRQADLAAAETQAAEALATLHQRISRLTATTRKGNLRTAQKELAATKKLSEAYQDKHAADLNRRLSKAEEAIEKLSDWHQFATEPKLLSLCEQMEALLESGYHPDKQAQEVSQLQKQWKLISYGANEALWSRFKVAADAAYAPCARFFAERQQQREQNLQKREPYITQIKELLAQADWVDDQDFKQAEQRLKAIHQGWQGVKDVAREEGKAQWQQYRELRDQVFARLAVAYGKNLVARQTLIKQLQAMLDTDADDNTLDKLKNIQARWREIGIVRAKDDRRSWKEFKHKGDLVFEHYQAFQQSQRDAYEQSLEPHKKIIEQILLIANTGVAADTQIESLEAEFASLPAMAKNFPEKRWSAIQSELRKALTQYQKQRAKAVAEQAKQQQGLVQEKAALCAQLEATYAKGDSTLASSIEQELSKLLIQDKAIEQDFAARISQAPMAQSGINDDGRRLLCIRLEIAANVDSPESDRALRTQLQLERMQTKGLSATAASSSKSDLLMKWYTGAGATPELEASLQERIEKLL